MKPVQAIVFALGVLAGTAAVPQEPAAAARSASSAEPMVLAIAEAPQGEADAVVLASAALVPSHAPLPHSTRSSVLPDADAAVPSSGREVRVAVLPPPPQKVLLENSYGAVAVDHAAHLARRASCKTCHGPGPVQKIGRLQPRQAHETCRNCHLQMARGPTSCRGCHLKKPEPETLTASAGPGAPASPKADRAAASAPNGVRPVAFVSPLGGTPATFDAAAAAAAFDSAAAWTPPRAAPPAGMALSHALPELLPSAGRRTVFAGLSLLAATGASPAPGVSLGVTFKQDGYQITDILEWSGGTGSRRTLGLVAAGVVLPVRERLTAHLLGVGGFDAADVSWTTFLPAFGARTGLEWTGARTFVQSIDLSLTALADVGRARDPRGNSIGGTLLSISLSAGLDLNSRR